MTFSANEPLYFFLHVKLPKGKRKRSLAGKHDLEKRVPRLDPVKTRDYSLTITVVIDGRKRRTGQLKRLRPHGFVRWGGAVSGAMVSGDVVAVSTQGTAGAQRLGARSER